MKRDGLISPDVLGSKTTTLPPVVTNYSNTRLGQWSKMEDLRLAAMSKQAQAALAGRPVLNAVTTAATRVAGPVLDLAIGALNPAVYAGVSATFGFKKLKNDLKGRGIILVGEEELYLQNYLAQGNIEGVKMLFEKPHFGVKSD